MLDRAIAEQRSRMAVSLQRIEEKLRILPRLPKNAPGGFYRMEAADFPLQETFAPNVYIRTIWMPRGSFVFGKFHLTEHANLVTEGSCLVSIDGEIHRIQSPCTFISKPGVRKILFMEMDVRWTTIHPTPETDPEKLRAMLVSEPDDDARERMNQDAEKLLAVIKGGAV